MFLYVSLSVVGRRWLKNGQKNDACIVQLLVVWKTLIQEKYELHFIIKFLIILPDMFYYIIIFRYV